MVIIIATHTSRHLVLVQVEALEVLEAFVFQNTEF